MALEQQQWATPRAVGVRGAWNTRPMPNIGGMGQALMNKGGQSSANRKRKQSGPEALGLGRDLKARGYVSLYSVGHLTIRSFRLFSTGCVCVCVTRGLTSSPSASFFCLI